MTVVFSSVTKFERLEFLPDVPLAFEDPDAEEFFVNAGWALPTDDEPVRTYTLDEVKIDPDTIQAETGLPLHPATMEQRPGHYPDAKAAATPVLPSDVGHDIPSQKDDEAMAKTVLDAVLDGSHDVVKNTCTKQVLCSAQPNTFAEANVTLALADVAMAPADFVNAAGDVSGRKQTMAAKAGVVVDVSGVGNHVALLDVAGARLLRVTTCAPVAVTATGTVDFGSWKAEIAGPA